MKAFILIVSILSFNLLELKAQINPVYSKSIENVRLNPSLGNIFDLADNLRGAARYGKQGKNGVDYYVMQETLMSIPGFAGFFADPIKQLRQKVQETTDVNKKNIIYHGEGNVKMSHDVLCINLTTLQYLPAAESVSVLGHFLEDPEGRDGFLINGGKAGISRSISGVACSIIKKIGIENPPQVEPSPDLWLEIDAWKQWWLEVKSGQRTYRFKGSPIEYNADGPVPGQALPQSARDHGRPLQEAAQQEDAGWPLWQKIAVAIAALVALLAAGFLIRRRARHAG